MPERRHLQQNPKSIGAWNSPRWLQICQYWIIIQTCAHFYQ